MTRRADDPPIASPRAWYATAATALVVAALMFIEAGSDTATTVAGLLVAALAATAALEGYRRGRHAPPSSLARALCAVLTAAAAVACLLGLASAPR